MTTVLVSGGTGLVGRYIVNHLLAHGYRVKVGSRTPPSPDLFEAEVEHVPLTLDPDVDQISAFDDVYHFVHAAFSHQPGRYRGGEGDDPEGFRTANLDGTIRLFETARMAGVRRTVFLSSRAVYDGLAAGVPLTEDRALLPTTLYGETKLKAEQALAFMSAAEPGFCGTSLRLTGVYGDLHPNKWEDIIRNFLAGKAVPSRAGSEVHGRDVGQAVRLMLDTEPGLVGGKAFNVSDVIADSRDILTPVASRAGIANRLPDPADKTAVRDMPTDRIRALGWRPGGQSLLDRTLEGIASAVMRSNQTSK